MRWLSLCFMHWRIDPAKLRHLVPPQLEIDTFDGSAWVGLVPFTMRDVGHYLPAIRRNTGRARRLCLPTATHFHECNVRTYVTLRSHNGAPPLSGVWFFSLDAQSRLGVWGGRQFWNLPYHYARITLANDEGGSEFRYSVSRRPRNCAAMRARWRVGPPLAPSRESDLAHFLTARYALFGHERRGRLRRSPIAHAPWPLREATVLELEESLFAAAGIDLDTNLARNPPRAWHVDELRVNAWPLRCCEVEGLHSTL